MGGAWYLRTTKLTDPGAGQRQDVLDVSDVAARSTLNVSTASLYCNNQPVVLVIFLFQFKLHTLELIMAAVWNRAGHYIFILCFLLFFLDYSQPSPIGCLPYFQT